MRVKELPTFVLIAAAAIAARLPFLLRADRFFDADEAVEGLMARHVPLGEHPLFLWGQRYKGVPEVYLSSAVLHFFGGSSVVALKAVTLGCFVLFLCLNFVLLSRMFSRTVAWIATAFLLAGPPSLVLWTLSGSAEIVMTLIAGAVLLLGMEAWRRSGSIAALVLAAAALGFGFWIQQYIVYYVVALALTAAIETPGWRDTVREQISARVGTWLRAVMFVAIAVAIFYIALGLVAFFTAGFDVRAAGVRVTATHPQKMWWIGGALLAVTFMAGIAAVFRRQLFWPAVGFAAGYSPALFGRISNHGMGAPIARMDFAALRAALPDITGVMLPILFGFRDPSGHATVFPGFFSNALPLLAIVLVLLVGWSFWQTWRRSLTPFFHLLVIVAPVMFLISGSYIDAQSYRYLMPIYAGLPVVYAIGLDGVSRATRAGGGALLVFLLLVFAAQQVDWYLRLEPDRELAAIIACLDRSGIRAARASYWQSYKITFLTGERIIVSPTDGVDRYPLYSAATQSSVPIDTSACR